MGSASQIRCVFVVVFVVGLVSVAGPATTYSQFVDAETSSGTVTAASNGGGGTGDGDPGPDGPNAYDDINRNGKFDGADETIDGDQLAKYNDQEVNLVIPSDVTGVEPQNGQVSITAASIDSEANITSNTNQVTLVADSGNLVVSETSVTGNQVTITASNGEVVLDDATITSNSGWLSVDAQSISATNTVFDSNGRIDLTTRSGGDGIVAGSGIQANSNGAFTVDAIGDVTLDDGTINPGGQATITSNGHVDISETWITAPTGAITVSGESIDASDGVLSSQNNGITLRSDEGSVGHIEASDVDIESSTGQIRFVSIGDVTLNNGNLSTQNSGISASLGTESAVLSIDGAWINDQDDILNYDPTNITVNGSPSSGSVNP